MIDNYEKEHADKHGETTGTETMITCPYCGYAWQDTWECGMTDGDVNDAFECDSCGREFKVVCRVTRTFQSFKTETITDEEQGQLLGEIQESEGWNR